MESRLIKHWTFRQWLMTILVVGMTVFAFQDKEARMVYFELAKIALGGYLGQQAPQLRLTEGRKNND